jgi:Fur family ferric uptake transcriptional regulator
MSVDHGAHHHHEHHDHPDRDVRIAAALERIQQSGGRLTTARRAVVTSLYEGADHHVTAEDIAARIQVEHPDIHLSTVYRTLEALEQLDVVARLDLGPGPAVFHLVDHAHHHLVCTNCGSVTEADAEVIESLARAVDERYGFAATPLRLTITGLCRACR